MREYRRILALVDLDDRHANTARRALALARLGGAELAFLHLIEPDPSLDGGYPPPGRAELRQGFEQPALRRLAFLAASLGAGEAECLARYGPTTTGLADAVGFWRPDLLVASEADCSRVRGLDTLIVTDRDARRGGRAFPAWRWLAGMLGGMVRA